MAGFKVNTAALTNHSRALSGLAGELRGAFDAAKSASMTSDAYGQTCARVAAMLDAIAAAGQETLLTGVEALETEVINLDETVRDYATQDAQGAAGLNQAARR